MSRYLKDLQKAIRDRIELSMTHDTNNSIVEVQITPHLYGSPILTSISYNLIGEDVKRYLDAKGVNNIKSTDRGERGGAGDAAIYYWLLEHKDIVVNVLKLIPPILKASRVLHQKYSRAKFGYYIKDAKPIVEINFYVHNMVDKYGYCEGQNKIASLHLLLLLPELVEIVSSKYDHFNPRFTVMAQQENSEGKLSVSFGDKLPTKKLVARFIRKIAKKHLQNEDSASFTLGKLGHIKTEIDYRYID
jgi:hypothetical protein